METKTTNLRTLQILYSSLMIGVVFFVLAAIFVVSTKGSEERSSQMESTFLTISLLSLMTIPIGSMIFRKKMEGIEQFPLVKKLELYQGAMIIRAALTEGSAFLCIVGYMITSYIYILTPALIALAVMGFFFPTKARLANELGVSESDLGQ